VASRRRTRQSSITGNISDVQRRLKYLEARPAPSKLGNYSVKPSNLEPRAVGTDQLGIGVVVQATVGTDAIGNDELGIDAVDSENIRENSVGTSELGTDAVYSENILQDAVGSSEIASDAVNSAEIYQDAVGSSELGLDAASAENIIVDGVGASEIGSDAVNSSEIYQDAVGASELGLDAASAENIIVDGVGASEIGSDAVNSSEIYFDAVGNSELGPDAATAENIDLDAVGASELAPDSVDAHNIIAGAVTGGYGNAIADDTIQSNNIGEDQVYYFHIPANGIGGSYDPVKNNITSQSIGGDDIKNRGIPNTKIELQGLTAAEIAPDAIGTSELSNNAVNTANIVDGAVTSLKTDGGFLRALGSSSPIYVTRTGTTALVGINLGTQSNQAARGDHTHTGGTTTVPAHTHSFTGSSRTTGGAAPNSHTHSFTAAGSVGGVQTSSRKLKREITQYEFDAKKLLNLQLTQFKYKNAVREIQDVHNREWMYGYIAEDVLAAGVEEILVYDKNKEPIALNYGILSTLVIELLKTQQSEIDSLKEEVQRLKDDK
jgi:hypothetical protein